MKQWGSQVRGVAELVGITNPWLRGELSLKGIHQHTWSVGPARELQVPMQPTCNGLCLLPLDLHSVLLA